MDRQNRRIDKIDRYTKQKDRQNRRIDTIDVWIDKKGVSMAVGQRVSAARLLKVKDDTTSKDIQID